MPAYREAKPGERVQLQQRYDGDDPVPPFAPAAPGMVAVFRGGKRVPVLYFDALGRPLVLDADEESRQLYPASEDDEFVRFEGSPGAPAPEAGGEAAST